MLGSTMLAVAFGAGAVAVWLSGHAPGTTVGEAFAWGSVMALAALASYEASQRAWDAFGARKGGDDGDGE